MLQLPFRLTLIGAALAAILPAHGAQPKLEAKAEPTTQKIEKVEIKGSAEAYNPRQNDTATKIVVNRDEIVKFGDTNVLDVLKRLPGITVAGNGARGSDIRMRGLGSGYTQILIDGEKAPAGFSIDTLAPDTIERIEVMRAATAEFSTQSIAGTINIVLRKAVRSAQRELKLRVVGSGEGSITPGMNLQLSDRIGKLAYSFSLNADPYSFRSAFDSVEESFDPQGSPTTKLIRHNVNDSRVLAYSANPRLTWTFANGDTLTSTTNLSANRSGGDQEYATETEIGQAPPFPVQSSERSSRGGRARTELNWIRKFAAGAKLDTKLAGYVGQTDSASRRYGYGALSAPLLLDLATAATARDRGYSFTGKYSMPLGGGHALMAGWDAALNRSTQHNSYDQQLIMAGARTIVDDTSNAQVRRFAVFAQDEWTVNKAWSVYGGLRWEGSRTEVHGSAFDSSRSSSGVWSPLFQTLYKLPGGKGDQLRFALTRTYKEPWSGMLVTSRPVGINNSKNEPYFTGNPNLKPEIAIGFDTSYEHYWAEGAMVSVSASMREIDGYTNYVTSQEANGLWVIRPQNNGKAHTRSIELEAKFPLKAIMANAPAVDFRANLSRNWSSVDVIPGPDNRLANQPELSGTAGADYKTGKLTTGASFTYRQGGRTRKSVMEVEVSPNVHSVDAYALWKFDAKSQVRFAVNNLLQSDYRSERIYADASGITRQSAVYPASVGFRLSLEFKY